MKKTIVVAALVILTGCTHRIKFDTLDIGLLLTDIPEEYNPTRKLSQCVVKVDTPCDFERDEYLNKMLGPDSSIDRSDKRNGIFYAPDVDTAVVCVYAGNAKCVELAMSRGKITSLQIWEGSHLLNEVKGYLGRDKQDGKYYFLSGIQKIYKNSDVVLERTSDYKDRCQKFIESEKRYIVDENLSYYKYATKEYVNYYDGNEAYYYGKTLDNMNYRKIGDAKFALKNVRYEYESGQQLAISDMLFIEKQPYVLYKTSVVKDGMSTFLAIFEGDKLMSKYGRFYGVFFNSQDPNEECTLEYAVELHFNTADIGKEYCEIDAINDYERPTYGYKVSIDSLGHIKFQYDGNANFPTTYMAYFQAPYHPWLEEGLRKRLEKELDISLENYRRKREYEEMIESTNARMVEAPCPECGGRGRIAQSGMGVVHGTLSCPCCHGRGTVKVDPYSAADREIYKNILYN